MTDLDVLVQRIYEDNVLGKLPDARYMKLSEQYETEQKEIVQLSARLEREIETETTQMVDMDKFFLLADKYAELSELTAAVVNELIEKIVIHSPEKRHSKKLVRIDVYFTYVGRIRIPLHIGSLQDQKEIA